MVTVGLEYQAVAAPAEGGAAGPPLRRTALKTAGGACDCCGITFNHRLFTIIGPDGGRLWHICTRCAGHISLKANGDIWLPNSCPDAPRPRLHVSHPDPVTDNGTPTPGAAEE